MIIVVDPVVHINEMKKSNCIEGNSLKRGSRSRSTSSDSCMRGRSPTRRITRSRSRSLCQLEPSSPLSDYSRPRGRSLTRRVTRSRSKSTFDPSNRHRRGRSATKRGPRSFSNSDEEYLPSTSVINSSRIRGRSSTRRVAGNKIHYAYGSDDCDDLTNNCNDLISSYDESSVKLMIEERENVKKRRGRPSKSRVAEENTDENDGLPVVQKSSSTGRPKRNARKPRKWLSDSSEDLSDEDEDFEESILKKNNKCRRFDSGNSYDNGTKHCIRTTRSNSINKRSRSSDSEPIVNKDGSPSKFKKRKLSPDLLPSLKGDKDIFCWQCHRHGNNMINCHICPRIYHKRCGKVTDTEPDKWICIECNAAMIAGSVQNPSEVKSLTQEELNQMLRLVMEKVVCQEESKHFKHPVDLNAYPNYTDYIIHPMDLSLVEKNINNNKYKTTESFVADMKWLLHNSHIFNSPYSELTTYAKRILKSVKQEIDEVETCANCYFNFQTFDEENWFTEPCEKPHLLVWAKLRGYPFWPAKVMRVANDLVDVRFFGDHNRSWLSPSACYLLSKSPPYVNKPGATEGYNVCMKEVFIHVKLLRDKFGTFVFASPRITYEPDEHKRMLHEMLPLLESSQNYGKTSFINKVVNRAQDGISFEISEKQRTALSISPGSTPKKHSLSNRLETSSEIIKSPVKPSNSNHTSVFTFDKKLQKVDKPFVQNNIQLVESQVNETDIGIQNSFENLMISDNDKETNGPEGDKCLRKSDAVLDFSSTKNIKMPKVVLTRIHIPSTVTKESQKENDVAEVILKKVPETAMNTLNCESVSQTGSTDLSNEVKGVKSPEPSNKIMLKVKSSAELLSSEALLKQKESSAVYIRENSLLLKPLHTVQHPSKPEVMINSSIKTKQCHVSQFKINETIEKVIRGDITVTLPSRERITCTDPRSTPSASSDLETDESSLPEEIPDEEVQVPKKVEKGTEGIFDFENETVYIDSITDVSSWSGKHFLESSTTKKNVEELINKLEHSLTLEECKTHVLALKELFCHQRNLVKEMSCKMKNEANEIYDIFVTEKEKISCEKEKLDKAVSKIKLTQWCNFCLKEANFYCCWGTSYCSSDCQQKDWDHHIEYCKQSDIKNDKLRLATPGSSKSISPAVTINKVPSSNATSNEVTITKAMNNTRPPFMAGKSQTEKQYNATATLQKGNKIISSFVQAKSSDIVLNKILTSKSINMPKTQLRLASAPVIKHSSLMLNNNKNEPQKVYVTTDQIKYYRNKLWLTPGVYKMPMASQMKPTSNVATTLSVTVPPTSNTTASPNSPNQCPTLVLFQKKENRNYQPINAITM